MRLERNVNAIGQSFRNGVKTLCNPIARRVALRTRLDLVRKNANQRSTEFRCEFCMGHGDADLISTLVRVRRMKRARSVNATDLDARVLYICLRPCQLRRAELRTTK
jgi:hypothetical protein